MIIFREATQLKEYLGLTGRKGNTIGFVPTMGALHQGHLSLIRKSKEQSGITVASIFINPTQFNDPKDFEKYPVTTENDIRLLIQESTDVLFLPSVEEIYPGGTSAQHQYQLGYLETILEGSHRPGHFQGVCQVVHRLLDIVQPHQLFLGQKDYQQCLVLKKLVGILQLPTQIIISDTIREPDGLAMSSRNMRLNKNEKRKATGIFKALSYIKSNIDNASFGNLQQQASAMLMENGFRKVDYVIIADAETLQPMPGDMGWDGQTPLVALIAAFMGDVRLIDNMLLT